MNKYVKVLNEQKNIYNFVFFCHIREKNTTLPL